ncbi:MAG: galactose oxidase-like domain-containing protein [Mycobacterium sp.]
MDVTILSGNQFRGAGNPGNQLGDGSSLFFRSANSLGWTEIALSFRAEVGNNKYFAATIPAGTTAELGAGVTVEYYLRIAYDDHDATFLHADNEDSVKTADEAAARATPFSFVLADAAIWGLWEPVFTFPNVAIHAHVLPNGRVLMWGRRDASDPQNLDVQTCTPFVWDPLDPLISPDDQNPGARPSAVTIPTAAPLGSNGQPVNLFCSGHSFLPDGRLLVVGGHHRDGDGLNQATIYTAAPAGSAGPGTWTAVSPMGSGEERRRWYPTAVTLPDGGVLVLSGSYWSNGDGTLRDNVALLQIWRDGQWRVIGTRGGGAMERRNLSLYPRVHVLADGRVLVSGTNPMTYLLTITEPGADREFGPRLGGNRDYAAAVLCEEDKVLYIGGGNRAVGANASPDEPRPPTADTEFVDFTEATPTWRPAAPMRFPRRQHNAVILPDGTVVVIGGTRGGGGARAQNGVVGFNDLGAGQPVHSAEMWDPRGGVDGKGAWQVLAAEEIDRCYHSTAVLLPDARVLSAGGGEYRPDDVTINDVQDTHVEAQIFSPPYLFRGDRPVIASAPSAVRYGQTFAVQTPDAGDITRISWIRLPSVTHSVDQNQRINVLTFTRDGDTLRVKAPATAEVCPPGHHMLFVLNTRGVPSRSAIIQIQGVPEVPPVPVAQPVEVAPLEALAAADADAPPVDGTSVVLGISGTCPYGIGACWGGAYEALRRLEGVAYVNPAPNAGDSTAGVVLVDPGLPDLLSWPAQFQRIVNGSYQLRGVEVTVRGVVAAADGALVMRRSAVRPEISLVPLSVDKVQWDPSTATPQHAVTAESLAYTDLATGVDPRGGLEATVTGPLTQNASGYRLHVRLSTVHSG